MIGLRYRGELLDLNPNASLSFELNNLVFSSSNSNSLPGSFSFPFEMPATAHNRLLLDFPDRIDNASPFLITGAVEVLFNGVVLFSGNLKVTEASAERIKVYIVANPLANMKSVPLNQLDLGGDRYIGSTNVLAHAKLTALSPLDYDYIFFPIYNRDFLTGEITNGWARWQNYYWTSANSFTVDHDHPALMPFVRLDYLLSRIFAATEYNFDNRFQVTDELKQIVLYNNRSMFTPDGLEDNINLRNHVSKTASSAFVRKIMGAFCLGMFYNPWDKNLRLIPMASLVKAPPAHDWTSKLLHLPTVSSNAEQPQVICWKQDDGDAAFQFYLKNGKPETVDGTVYWTDLASAPEGLYYVIDRHGYYWKFTLRYSFVYSTLGCAPQDTGSPAFEAECMPLFDARLFESAPDIRMPGSVSYELDGETITQENDIPDRMTIYRGFQTIAGNSVPFGSGIPYDIASNQIGDYSLRMDGPMGMYETWWKDWHNMLKTGKNVSARLHLSLTDIINFNLEDKVRIQNNDFFVKRLRVTLTPRGIAPVDVELVSVI